MSTKLIYKILSHNVKETESAGALLAALLKKGDFVAMYGDLGVGKTAFVRGVAALLVPDADVCSPTYAICNEYEGKNVTICHFDVYRILSDEDLYACGFYDYVDCVSIVEWSENIPFALPEEYYRVSIAKVDGGDADLRTIAIEKVSE